jgi:subtilisin-like proprotein convertase family protein
MVPLCQSLIFSEDTPVEILSSEPNTVQSTLNVENMIGGGVVEDANIYVELSHSRLSDLVVSLTSPGGTTITLLDRECGDLDDVDVIFDDKGVGLTCNVDITPTLSGTIKPEEKLSLFENENILGNWILTVEDVVPNNGGSLDSFGIEICEEPILSVNDLDISQFKIYPNPNRGIAEISFDQNLSQDVEIEIINLTGKVVKRYNLNNSGNTFELDLSDLSSGIYLVKLQTDSRSAVKKLILK